MAFTIASFAITCAICYGIFRIMMWHMGRRHLYKLASKFDGPAGLPIIGGIHLLLGNSEHLLSKIEKLMKLYPSPLRFWLGPRLIFVVSDPEQAKVICTSPKTLGKGDVMDLSVPLVGTGLVTAPVPKWKVNRKLIQPTFNTKILDCFVEVLAAQSKILTEQMEGNLNGPEFEIFNFISFCTLDMACEAALGVKVGAQINRNHQYAEALDQVMAGFRQRLFSPWLYPDFIFYRTQLGKNQRMYIKYLHDFSTNVIQTRRAELLKRSCQPGTADNEDDTCNPASRRGSFLDHLMKLSQASGNLSDEAIREEVDGIVVGAIETAANTVSYVMLMLASNPDVQEKVYQELYEIYGDYDIKERPVTSEDLSHMKYLERVIKETLRLFPPIPFIIRAVTGDLDIGDHPIPNGSSVVIGILRLHRNEKYWPDPLKFDPDRFLPGEIADRHPYAFLAFSGGPRNCIGLVYSMMSMKTMLATVLRKYILRKNNVVPIKDIRLKLEVFLKPVNPIKIRIESRSRR